MKFIYRTAETVSDICFGFLAVCFFSVLYRSSYFLEDLKIVLVVLYRVCG